MSERVPIREEREISTKTVVAVVMARRGSVTGAPRKQESNILSRERTKNVYTIITITLQSLREGAKRTGVGSLLWERSPL